MYDVLKTFNSGRVSTEINYILFCVAGALVIFVFYLLLSTILWKPSKAVAQHMEKGFTLIFTIYFVTRIEYNKHKET